MSGTLAAAQAGQAAAQAMRPAPAISGSRNQNRVTIGAPTFYTRPSQGMGGIATAVPLLAVAGLAGLVLWRAR